MKRILAQTFVIQGLGVALMFGVTLLVSRLGGPTVQGNYALIKSTIDVQTGILSLGLPPAIVFLLNRTSIGHKAVFVYSLRYYIVLMAILPLINYLLFSSFPTETDNQDVLLQSILVGWAGASIICFGLLRGLFLHFTDGPKFSLVSILHWVIIFSFVAFFINSFERVFEIAYCLAGLISLVSIIFLLRKYRPIVASQDIGETINWGILRVQSSHVLMQAIFFGFQPFLTTAVLVHIDPSSMQAGLFSVASLIITLPNLLVALVAPVLFNRWSKTLDWIGFPIILRNALLIGGMGQVAAIASLPLVGIIIAFIFGPEFIDATRATQILLCSVFAVFAGRILTAALQGIGLTHKVTISCIARFLGGSVVAALLLLNSVSALTAFAVAWTVGEYFALAYLLLTARRGIYGNVPYTA